MSSPAPAAAWAALAATTRSGSSRGGSSVRRVRNSAGVRFPAPAGCPAANAASSRTSRIVTPAGIEVCGGKRLRDDRQLAAVAGRDRAAVRAASRVAEERADAVRDLGVDDVLHPAGGDL